MAEDSCSTGSSDSRSGFGASMPVAMTSDRLPPADAPLGLERSRLMLPLNEIVDEHYSVYWCRLAPDQPPPEYCLP